MELAQVWHDLRREVEDRSVGIRVTVRLSRERLDMVTHIAGGYFTAPPVSEARTELACATAELAGLYGACWRADAPS
ncbi:hypothetical protein [Streptomyces kanamyceticus]|uniref:Uncharacterized protein n=1 Tax=Streptomyces kanamyceticus TaxID=1967 RepID=A0A5J6G2X8_STRKN|nr:hypothetical protein [Streptomyces kanamyceticus]QEU89909.1 hypothetical protein CP970_02365 [Streptomyces kanamyceticus]